MTSPRHFSRRAILRLPTANFTPIAHFYRPLRNHYPVMDDQHWQLTVAHDGHTLHTFTLDMLRAFPTVALEATLCCADALPMAGRFGHALWRGLSLASLLAETGVSPAVNSTLHILSADGRTTVLPAQLPSTAMLAYEMNGQRLPAHLGAPLRLIIPGHYDDQMPTWVTRIDLRSASAEPVQLRPIHIMSAFDEPQRLTAQTTQVNLSGVAYAGMRKITRVELSIDEGPWAAVELMSSKPGCWSRWQMLWRAPTPGHYSAVVRATDETGSVQSEQPQVPASTFHRIRLEIGTTRL